MWLSLTDWQGWRCDRGIFTVWSKQNMVFLIPAITLNCLNLTNLVFPSLLWFLSLLCCRYRQLLGVCKFAELMVMRMVYILWPLFSILVCYLLYSYVFHSTYFLIELSKTFFPSHKRVSSSKQANNWKEGWQVKANPNLYWWS